MPWKRGESTGATAQASVPGYHYLSRKRRLVTNLRFGHHRRMIHARVSMRPSPASPARALSRLAAVGVLALLPFSSRLAAQPAPPSQPVPQSQTQASDPVVAKVDGDPIRLSDVQAAAQSLPEAARSMPPQALFPMLLDQMIDGRALAAEARKTGLDKDPEVKRQVDAAADRALQTAILQHEVGPLVTDTAVRARYDKDVAGKPGAEEV